MFGDKKSVLDSSLQLNANLHKRHTMLTFHRVREVIAAGITTFHFLSGDDNPADILSKHCGCIQIIVRLKALLFWKADTADIQEGEATFQEMGSVKFLAGVFQNAISTAIKRNERLPAKVMTSVERSGDTGSTCST
jgi:hypothetical protein